MPEEQNTLRAYILGEIGDRERSLIEERLMTDEDFFRELALVEETVIQDYVDGHLEAAERANFEKRFLITEENRQRVRFARALRRYVTEAEPGKAEKPEETRTAKTPGFFDSLKAFFTTPVPAALMALIVLGFAGFLIWKSFQAPPGSEVLTALNKAYRTERPFEARITDLEYAPPKNTRGDADKTNRTELALAREIALRKKSENPTAENLHALGRVYLAEKNFDEAISEFEKAVQSRPDNAALHNDLGVALMEKAALSEDESLKNLTAANEQFSRAIALDKTLLAAYFNQALGLQRMPGLTRADEAWRKYLELDPASKWAEEARKNLQAIEAAPPVSKTKEEILREFLQARMAGDDEKAWQTLSQNRSLSEGKLIPQQLAFLFVDAKLLADQAAAGHLEALRYAGRLEEERSGDLFWKTMAEFYAQVSNDRIPLLKQAQSAYLQGMNTIKTPDYAGGAKELEAARNLYRRAGNDVETQLIDFIIAYCRNRLSRIEESSAMLTKLYEFCRKENYKWLGMNAEIWLATNDLSVKKYSACLRKLETAAGAARETNDLYNRQKVSALFTDIYLLIGRFDDAFGSLQQSLRLSESPDADPKEKWRTLSTASRFLHKFKNANSALAYARESLYLADQTKETSHQMTSLIDLGLINSALGNTDEAVRSVEKGLAMCAKIAKDDFQKKCAAKSNLELGHIKRQDKQNAAAIENYQKALSFYDESQFQYPGYDAHRGLLLSYLAENNEAAVDAELAKILTIFESYRQQIIEEQNRNSFFDGEQDVYDIAVEISFRRGDHARALDYAEQSRSRSLRDLQNSPVRISNQSNRKPEITFLSGTTEPLTIDRIRAEMPAGTQLLQYSVLKDKTLIWLYDRENLNAVQTDTASEILKEKVSAYLESIARRDEPDEQRRLSAELYDILIGPVKDRLDARKEIFIVPDKFLFDLPFNTLFSGRYLIEHYRLSYAPSANVFLVCSKKAESLGGKTSETILSIGNPKFDRADYNDELQPLAAAEREAIEIAGFYDARMVFVREEATKDRVIENFKTADVVHFAGHYVVNEHAPLLSSLVVAGGDKADSDLANYEIIGEKHPRMRLIVLSACRTGVEKYYNGEGMIGASRTFLATGVPLVVASQWAVDSDASKELMVRFHRHRKTNGLSTAEALRRSQLEMLQIERYNQPYYWAAFASIGGYAQF